MVPYRSSGAESPEFAPRDPEQRAGQQPQDADGREDQKSNGDRVREPSWIGGGEAQRAMAEAASES